ncbi:hypothetical protein [Mycolicibacterium vinylchloridicum]|uniref:hypothetical protein n=1 Tax=Mycolicibacterium vinylchloridicum TaxID=2736928 RepID=UPI0015C9D680|nr:hypothetical protein [Mycolicibacterium vinylchloridicum]
MTRIDIPPKSHCVEHSLPRIAKAAHGEALSATDRSPVDTGSSLDYKVDLKHRSTDGVEPDPASGAVAALVAMIRRNGRVSRRYARGIK